MPPSFSALFFSVLLHLVCAQNEPGRTVLKINPVEFENHGELDRHGKACRDDCSVRMRYCYAVIQERINVPLNERDQSFCDRREAVSVDVPEFFNRYFIVPLSGHPTYSYHMFQAPDGESQIRLPFNTRPKTKLAIWYDVSHLTKILDDTTNITIIEHRLVAQQYREISINTNLLPNEDPQEYKFIRNVDFKEGLHTLHGWIELKLNIQMKCQPFWHGCLCKKYCMANDKYSCDDNGNRVCNAFWYTANNTDNKCLIECRPHGKGMFCSEHGQYKCYSGYQGDSGAPPSQRNPCEQISCKNTKVPCPTGTTCQNSAENNEDDPPHNGFYKCVPNNT